MPQCMIFVRNREKCESKYLVYPTNWYTYPIGMLERSPDNVVVLLNFDNANEYFKHL